MNQSEKCQLCGGRGFILEPGEPSIGDYKISCGYCNGTGIAKGARIVSELAAFRAHLSKCEAENAALRARVERMQIAGHALLTKTVFQKDIAAERRALLLAIGER